VFQHDGSSERFLRGSIAQTPMDVGPELPYSQKWHGRVSSPWLERILFVSSILIFSIIAGEIRPSLSDSFGSSTSLLIYPISILVSFIVTEHLVRLIERLFGIR
jgi:hypothetical protein